ncbi:zf-HC2 domain-containing protein [Bradyrhizobium lablabi]|uniref:zf-HC2 domain-containing protein n=1 Tax=Bradyrhizobium lablabi TaxID=722472 RepID=UPI001BA46397|nr:zf-HC2 domain-containing protein [Bradyrhizobium lablabi]MBR1121384.1 zf-HC2 domain-containing protein [Bradyrhizobium lablabi]
MTETEKLLRDIETLRTSMQLDWIDLAGRLSPEERAGIREHLETCHADLKGLLKRLWTLEDGENSN